MEAISIALVVLTASLVGSGHCVGMCGPFALIAGRSESSSWLAGAWQLASYHVGRLVTYLLLGLIAGWTGSLVDAGGDLLGWQRLAAWVTGSAMIAYGLFALLRLSRVGSVHFPLSQNLGKLIQKGYRWSSQLSGAWRSLMIGGITAWLPCGWLYAFVLIALGTSNPLLGPGVMLVFWIGTLPLLSVFVLGVHRLSENWKRWIPTATAVLLIVSGCFTISVRAAAMFDDLEADLAGKGSTVEAVNAASEATLPCCHPGNPRD